MYELKTIPGTELSEYVIHLLHKHEIGRIWEFLEADSVKLAKITNISEESIMRIKTNLRHLYNPQSISLRKYYTETINSSIYYRTNIRNLDTMVQLNSCGQLMEICGISGIGKSILCMTMTVNFVINHEIDILYIDTKNDFSGMCIKRILDSKNISNEDAEKIMFRIKVERVYSLEGVIKILEQLIQNIRDPTAAGADIKVVFIDSLPAVSYLLHGEDYSHKNRYYLSKLANTMRKLAKECNVAVIFVNLLIEMDEDYFENADTTEAYSVKFNEPTSSKRMKLTPTTANLKPSLGKYWKCVPTLRLVMEERSAELAADIRCNDECVVIRVVKSCYSATGLHCEVYVTDSGVV